MWGRKKGQDPQPVSITGSVDLIRRNSSKGSVTIVTLSETVLGSISTGIIADDGSKNIILDSSIRLCDLLV